MRTRNSSSTNKDARSSCGAWFVWRGHVITRLVVGELVQVFACITALATRRRPHRFFAIGGYSTWGKGKAFVEQKDALKTYRLEFEYKFYDRYNWDAGKSVTIVNITITDHFMGEFHRQGLAREFDCYGSLRRNFTWRQGEAISSAQLQQPVGGRG